MRSYVTGLAAIMAAGLVGSAWAHGEDAAGDGADMTAAEARAIVEARNADFEALFAADDAQGLATKMYTANGRLIPPDAPDMVGPEAIETYWTGALGAIETVDLTTDEAIPVGEGYIAERAHVTLYGADGEAMGTGKATLLWTLEDGDWKMQWDSWNNGPVE